MSTQQPQPTITTEKILEATAPPPVVSPTRKDPALMTSLFVLLVIAGALVTLWTRDWRYAGTGALAALALPALGLFLVGVRARVRR